MTLLMRKKNVREKIKLLMLRLKIAFVEEGD